MRIIKGKKAIHMLKHNRTNAYDFNYHLVCVTKYRKEIFTSNQQRTTMKDILKRICEQRGIEIEHMEVMPEHIHLLISFPPLMAPASAVKAIKGVSARDWFKAYPETKQLLYGGHLWSPSYFMATVGNVSKQIVANYIETQMQRSARIK